MTTPRAPLTDEAARSLTLNTHPWLSCDDCFDTVDVHVDAVLAGDGLLPEAFRVHLVGCSACFEEAISLAVLVAPGHRLHPQRAKDLLERAVLRTR
jgi:hypothetical protein